MNESLAYREERFTPSEAEACTGLSLAMQRDWRRHGHLPARAGSAASFRPHELAEIRLMVKMRQMGLGPSKSRSVAQEAAASVLLLALVDHPTSWEVDGPPGVAEEYSRYLKRLDDRPWHTMAGTGGRAFAYGITQGDQIELVPTLVDDEIGDEHEVTGVLSLKAVANRLVKACPRPLFTIIPPPTEASRRDDPGLRRLK